METTPAYRSEENSITQKTKMKPEERASAERSVDKTCRCQKSQEEGKAQKTQG